MMTLKERKEMEDAFKKAQKPWAKLLQKVEKAKSEYHNSCKTERTAANMERNASADSSLSPDQVRPPCPSIAAERIDQQPLHHPSLIRLPTISAIVTFIISHSASLSEGIFSYISICVIRNNTYLDSF